MPTRVKIILAVVIIVFIASVAASIIFFRPADRKSSDEHNYIEIVQDGKVINKIDLAGAENQTFRIEYNGGWNDITIKDEEIYISDADCPDHTCIKTGKLRSEYVPIVCLPHKLIIRFSE